jgi:DNA-binding LacI/PurR family transcriptional regulator
LAIIEEKAAPDRPRAKSTHPTGPARGSKMDARAVIVGTGALVLTDAIGGVERGVDGFDAGEALFRAVTRPTAVFAANDNIAMGIMAAAHRHGLRIGPDVTLVGYNDTPLASRLPTPLTSVHVHLDQIARTAIDLLMEPGSEPRVRKSIPTLIPRESRGPRLKDIR